MYQPTLLVLDCQPEGSLGQEFLSVIEPNLGKSNNLLYQPFNLTEPHRGKEQMAHTITQCRPSLIFLVAPPDLINQLKTVIDASIAPMILITEDADSEDIYALLTLGLADYIVSPLDIARILPRVWRLLGDLPGDEGRASILGDSLSLQSIVGESRAFLSEISKIPLIAGSEDCVLITGETGTGKEVCAQAIHQLSTHRHNPFVPLNCGAIPAELLENELFGHERGAYTGAEKAYPGLIEMAKGGTLFLDEINSLPLSAQAKLLRFLQEKEYRSLGSRKLLKADVRVVAAANVDLEREARAGLFREDLYHRLNVMRLELPPLRRRLEDIPLLTRHFLAKHSADSAKQKEISTDAILALMIYEWPGNVRELEHVIQQLTLCGQSIITSAEVRRIINVLNSGSILEAKEVVIERFERNWLEELLRCYGGNITRAAQAAEMYRPELRQLIKKHGMNAQKFKNN